MQGTSLLRQVAIASANSGAGPASSPPQVWLQEERGGGHCTRCLPRAWQASSSLPSSTSLSLQVSSSREKVIHCCAFRPGLGVLMAQSLCVNVTAWEYRAQGRRLFVGTSVTGRKSELVTLSYLQSSKETRAAMEGCSLVSDGFDHLAELPFVKCCIKELCLFLYLFPSCWDGRSCQQKPPWYQPTWKYLAKSWPMSTSIRKSCIRLWRYQGPLIFFARFDTVVLLYLNLSDLCFTADCARTCRQEHSDEENRQPNPQRHRRTMDAASVAGRAAIHRSYLHGSAAGVRVIHDRSGTCGSQRWVGVYEIRWASSEQAGRGTG